MQNMNAQKPEWLKNFFFMNAEKRLFVASWLSNVVTTTFSQEVFVRFVKKALSNINYDYWIAAIEPSMGEGGKLAYKYNAPVVRGINSLEEWKKKCEEFCPELNSQMADIYELYLWYAYRVSLGNWELSFICDGLLPMSSHMKYIETSRGIRSSGRQKIGGFSDGVINTYKIVKYNNEMALVGNHGIARFFSISKDFYYQYPWNTHGVGVGVVVLRHGEIE